jgi:Calcineurin-like phosphoesterase
MSKRDDTWAVGDIHGALPRLKELLQQAAITDRQDRWRVGAMTGVTIGDYLNRGEQGAQVIQFIRQLQYQAAMAGGELIALLGNHDVLMCGVLSERQSQPYGTFASQWLLNGGRFLDLEALERDPQSQDWLRARPAMALVGDTLYIHSDTLAYLELGKSIDSVNAEVSRILESGNLDRIATLFNRLCRRGELRDPADVQQLLSRFGGQRVVHGHTPIFANAPRITHDGRCIAIDGALWDDEADEPLGFVFTG